MISVRITCNGDASRTIGGGIPCPYADLEVDPGRSLDFQIYDQLKPLGWSFNGPDQQFCPHHNPDLAGQHIVISRDYIEPVPGVRLRLRDQAVEGGGSRVHVEILLDKARYDVEMLSRGAWRAKHISDEWPDKGDGRGSQDTAHV